MNTKILSEKHTAAIMMGVVLCFTFFLNSFAAVQAQETENEVETVASEASSSDDVEERAAMLEQIESLRKMIAERKGERREEYEEKKEEVKADIAEKKAEFKVDKAEFMASLEGLPEEEKRAAMLEFIQNIKALIDAKKAEIRANVEMKKEDYQEAKAERTENRDEFRSSLEGLSKEDKIAAILARVAAIKAQMESADSDEDEMEDEAEDNEEMSDDDSNDDEMDDEAEDEMEDEEEDDEEMDDES